MINWFDMPAEGLSNGGLFEIKELEVTENGTYEQSGEMYNKVTVNVEGGGGSSDFSTAEVTTINNTSSDIYGVPIPSIYEENELGEGSPAMLFNRMDIPTGESTHEVRMYKGLAYCSGVTFGNGTTVTTTGNIVYDEEFNVFITGDGTITIS